VRGEERLPNPYEDDLEKAVHEHKGEKMMIMMRLQGSLRGRRDRDLISRGRIIWSEKEANFSL
jgi:hypothetical protein